MDELICYPLSLSSVVDSMLISASRSSLPTSLTSSSSLPSLDERLPPTSFSRPLLRPATLRVLGRRKAKSSGSPKSSLYGECMNSSSCWSRTSFAHDVVLTDDSLDSSSSSTISSTLKLSYKCYRLYDYFHVTYINFKFMFQRGQGSLETSIICPQDLSLSIIHYSNH